MMCAARWLLSDSNESGGRCRANPGVTATHVFARRLVFADAFLRDESLGPPSSGRPRSRQVLTTGCCSWVERRARRYYRRPPWPRSSSRPNLAAPRRVPDRRGRRRDGARGARAACSPRTRGCAATSSTSEGVLRKHMVVFVDGSRSPIAQRLSDAVGPRVRDLRDAGAVRRMMMKSMLLVSTRKGLFVVEGEGADARIARAAFVGDNVTLAMVDRRDGTLVRRARPRPLRRQAASLRRSRRDLDRDRDAGVSAEARGLRRQGHVGQAIASGRPRTSGRSSRRSTPTARCGAARMPGRPVPLRRSRRVVATRRVAVEPPDAREVERRRRRSRGDPLDLRRSARSEDRRRRGLERRRVAHARRRRDLGARTRRACAPTTCRPSRPSEPENQDPAPRRAVPRRRPHVFWCQHHMGIWRSTDDLATWHQIEARAVELRLRGRGAPARSRHRVVRPGALGPEARADRRPGRRDPHARRRQDASRSLREGLPQQLRLRSGAIATRSRSPTTAYSSRSARRPATCGSRPTRATAGTRSPTICRRSTRSDTPDRRTSVHCEHQLPRHVLHFEQNGPGDWRHL